MATERQSPDAILAQTDLSGAVTDIDDDPDAADGLWLTATNNNVNVDVRVSFPTPTGNPTVGADLQEFRAQVREFDTGQTGTPTARIELWENGSLVRAGTDVNVIGTNQVISFTWNANELGTADGSLVECKVVGTRSGGSPGARNTVEVGAVEWNVDYTTGPTTFTQTITGTAVGSASVAPTATFSRVVSAAVIGLADLVKQVSKTVSATQIGAASLAPVVTYVRTVSTTVIGVASVSGKQVILATISAVAAPVATVTPLLVFGANILATAVGAASVAGAAIYSRLITTSQVGVPSLQKMIGKTISAASLAQPSLLKTVGKVIQATQLGAPSVDGGLLVQQAISAAQSGIATVSEVFIAAGTGFTNRVKRAIKVGLGFLGL